ncbi:MAG: hypothetical protein HXY18_20155 [Bryobacteraceae bacterium]|nr:hypothetical protein [Bryobacteraceae bacterium]
MRHSRPLRLNSNGSASYTSRMGRALAAWVREINSLAGSISAAGRAGLDVDAEHPLEAGCPGHRRPALGAPGTVW